MDAASRVVVVASASDVVVRSSDIAISSPRGVDLAGVGRCAMRGGLLLVCHVALAAWKACPESAIGCAGSCTGTSKCKFCKCRACDVCKAALASATVKAPKAKKAELKPAATSSSPPPPLAAAKSRKGSKRRKKKKVAAPRAASAPAPAANATASGYFSGACAPWCGGAANPLPDACKWKKCSDCGACNLLPITTATDPPPSNAGYALAAAGPVIALVGCFFYARARSPPTTVTGGQFAIEEDR